MVIVDEAARHRMQDRRVSHDLINVHNRQHQYSMYQTKSSMSSYDR